MRVSRRWIAGLAAAAVTAAVVVPAAWSTSADPIKLGIIGPTGTTVANIPQDVAAAKAAVNALNKRGGLKGRQVSLVYCNDKNDPNLATSCARQMVSEKVAAIVGGLSLTNGVIPPILAKAGIPMIGWSPQAAADFTTKNIYLFTSGSVIGYNLGLAWLGKKQLPTGIVSADNSFATALREGLKGTLTAAGGDFTSTVLVSPTQADYAPLVQASRQSNPKALLMFTGQEQGQQFIRSSEAAGDGPRYYLEEGLSPSFIKNVGTAGDKMLTTSSFPPFTSSNPLIKQFLKEYTAEKAAGDGDADITKANDISFGPWLAVWTLEMMAKKGLIKDFTAAGVTKALNSAKKLDMKGVIPAWTPNATGPKGLERASNPAQFVIGYRNGGQPYLLAKKALTIPEILAGKF
jgi:ABC-type branched-subunit amino acid transport system substrate-binding protein